MTVTNLNIFQSGTIASVVPVNENFETLRVAINSVEQNLSEQRNYLNKKVDEINENIEETSKAQKCSGNVFCVNSGNLDASGKPCILSVSGTTLSFITPFVATNIDGETINFTSVSDISISGYSQGRYNVFVDLDSGVEIIENKIFRTEKTPDAQLNDVWFDLSQSPLSAKKLTTSGWEDFKKIPLGCFVVSENGKITVATNLYNQNGYSITANGVFPMPDYTKGISLVCNVEYKAETSGWIYAYHYSERSNLNVGVSIDGQFVTTTNVFFSNLSGGTGNGVMLPVAKGSVYSAKNLSVLKFFPVKTI